MHEYTKLLLQASDEKYKIFSQKLKSGEKYEILGVKMPAIKEIVKYSTQNPTLTQSFLNEKHIFLEEWMLHGLILSTIKNVNALLVELERFVPYIDGWAVCDCFCASLKIVAKNRELFLQKIKEWASSPAPYTIRFAIVLLLDYFCLPEYSKKIHDIVANINSEHYYVKMAIAWLYSVLLVKDYGNTVKYFEKPVFDKFTHNKAIQKSIESFRIDTKKKKYLQTLKVK